LIVLDPEEAEFRLKVGRKNYDKEIGKIRDKALRNVDIVQSVDLEEHSFPSLADSMAALKSDDGTVHYCEEGEGQVEEGGEGEGHGQGVPTFEEVEAKKVSEVREMK